MIPKKHYFLLILLFITTNLIAQDNERDVLARFLKCDGLISRITEESPREEIVYIELLRRQSHYEFSRLQSSKDSIQNRERLSNCLICLNLDDFRNFPDTIKITIDYFLHNENDIDREEKKAKVNQFKKEIGIKDETLDVISTWTGRIR